MFLFFGSVWRPCRITNLTNQQIERVNSQIDESFDLKLNFHVFVKHSANFRNTRRLRKGKSFEGRGSRAKTDFHKQETVALVWQRSSNQKKNRKKRIMAGNNNKNSRQNLPRATCSKPTAERQTNSPGIAAWLQLEKYVRKRLVDEKAQQWRSTDFRWTTDYWMLWARAWYLLWRNRSAGSSGIYAGVDNRWFFSTTFV